MTWRTAAVIALLCACNPVAIAGEPAGTAEEGAPGARSNEGRHVNMLSKKTLGVCREPDYAIVLARVTKARIRSPGTRSEMAIVEGAVERVLCGDPPQTLNLWRYTSGGNTYLKEGHKYIVVSRRAPGPEPYSLGEFVLVDAGKEDEVVQAHLSALARKSGAKR